MANQGEEENSEIVTFDLFDGNLLLQDDIVLQELTEEQREAIQNHMDTAHASDPQEKDTDFQAFEEQAATSRHVMCTATDVDKIAGQNNTDSTKWQTKWAVTVFKGNFTQLSVKFFF